MTLEDAANLAEIIGVVVVVVTLIYLAVQVRQGTAILRSEARQAQVSNDQNGVFRFLEFPELGRLFSQAATPTSAEKTQLAFWIIGQMRAREHEFLQHRSGAMDDETFLAYRGVIHFLLGTRRARELWGLCRGYFDPDFAEMVDGMIDGTPEIDFWERLAEVE